jgi:SagB-type dehydrogenase family enzyme
MSVRYAVEVFDSAGLAAGDGLPWGERPPVTSLTDLAAGIAERRHAGVATCVIGLMDAGDGARRLRTELNRLALDTGTLLVPCVRSGLGTVLVGPWMRGRSTPCLECFSPAGLAGLAGAFRFDEIGDADGMALLGSDPSAAHDERSLMRTVLRDVAGMLQRSLVAGTAKSVWGRVVSYRLRADGGIEASSWRALKEPGCHGCAPGAPAEAAPAGHWLFRVLHEHTKMREHFRPGDVIDVRYGAEDASGAPAAGAPAHPLPDQRSVRTIPVEEAIIRRRSRRRFGPGELSREELAAVLYYAGGVTDRARTTGGGEVALRAAPSGGALYPVDLYACVRRVGGVAPGVYRYDPQTHALVEIPGAAASGDALARHSAYREMLLAAPALILLAARFDRSATKYLERAYRLVLLEAGHIAQNIQLVSTARRLRSCCVAGFVEDLALEVVGAGHLTEVLYLVAVGR